MFRAFHPARTKSRKGLTSALAVALALATGVTVGVTGFAAPALAQPKPKYSKGFVAAYEPVAAAFNAVVAGGDYGPVKAQLGGVVSAIENEDDRYTAGQLVLQVGNKTTDPALQRQGLELMLASGKVAPTQVGQFQFFVGSLAFQSKDYPAARTALQAATDAGYTEGEPEGLVFETYVQEKNFGPGLDYFAQTIRKHQAAGQQVPDHWLKRGLQVAYNQKLAAPANDFSSMLVAAYPTPDNWLMALQVARELNKWSNEEVLDLSRLMALTGAMQEEFDLVEYVEAADPRKLANEVIAALDAAEAAGVIQKGAPRFAEFRRIAEGRAEADRAETPGLKAEAQSAATGTVALGVADTFLSFGGYADAEAMYQLALDKGGIDAARALTRKGIAQVRQGKLAEAKATFAQVEGVRAPIAHMWTVYIDSQRKAVAAAPAG